jgi:hypothetical protein
MPELEEPTQLITLRRASELSGVAATTLANQARSGKLRTVKVSERMRMTTRVWLHAYLLARDQHRGRPTPLPPDYVPPE